ncbi:discoidin domain-containing protein [Actinomycetes bacterium KLBMP 9797]
MPKRLMWTLLASGLALLASSTPATADRTRPELALSTDVSTVEVLPQPCPRSGFELRFGNAGARAVYADAFVDAPPELRVSREVVTSYLPAGYELKVRVQVTAAVGTVPGEYALTLRAGNARRTLPVTVLPAPENPTGNLARFATVLASSEHLPVYPACGTTDGDRDSAHWGSSTGWNDGTRGRFPDWLQVTFPALSTVGRVDLYTLDSARYPAARYGLRDWDVQVDSGGQWVTVAQVRGNTAGLASSVFAPVSTQAVRILTLASNEGLTYSRVVELEASPA